MEPTEHGWGIDLDLESEKIADEFKRMMRIFSWALTALMIAAAGLSFLALSSASGPTLLEFGIWIVVLIVVDFLPIKPFCVLHTARGSGVDVRYIVVPPFAIVRERDRLRAIPGMRWSPYSGHIVPTSAAVDCYLAAEPLLAKAILKGQFLTGLLHIVLAVLIVPITGAYFIPGLFGLAALRALLVGAWGIVGIRHGQPYGEQFPGMRVTREAGLRTATAVIEGTRPRDIELTQVEAMLAAPRGTAYYVSGRIAAAACLSDRGRNVEAAHLADEAHAATHAGLGLLHYQVLLAVAFYAADVRHDPATARRLFRAARWKSPDRYHSKLVDARILQEEGRMADARAAALAGLALVPKALSKGDAAVGKGHLEEIVAAAEREPAGASV